MSNFDVSVVGLGYIGLPTSAVMADAGLRVCGFDVNRSIIDTVNKGQIHIIEPGLEDVVSQAVMNGKLQAFHQVNPANTYLIVVPTPFKENNEPNITYVEKASDSVIPHLKENDLFIIESTCPVNTTTHIAERIYRSRPELKNKIHIAYCPERVLPGNVIHELVENDRVIGGINEESTNRAISFYRSFVKGSLHGTNSATAEMCKLVENSSRDVQIAFANELSLICDKAGINVWELISLANKHPRVNILTPGCGVGGHCIAVDPYFITSSYPLESQIIGQARKINNYKAFWCTEKIKNEILQWKLKYSTNPTVALMGLAFKPNIDDLRESPAKYIVDKVTSEIENSEYLIVEPNIETHSSFKISSYEEACKKADIIAFLVGHKEFKEFKASEKGIILDFCGVTQK